MTDEIAGDVGGDAGLGGGDGSFEGGEPADGGVDIAAVEQAFNADALAKLGIESAPGTKEDGSGAPPSKAEQRRIDAFIEKNYGGDEDAFLAAQYSQREEGKRNSQRIKELEEAIKNPPSPRDIQAELQAAFNSHPDAQSIDRRMQAADSRIKQVDREQASLAMEAGKINNSLGELNSRLQAAPEEDRSRLYSEINRLENRMAVINSEWKSNSLAKDTNADLLETLRYSRDRVVREIQESMARQEEQSRSEVATAERVRNTFDSSFEAIAQELGVDTETDRGRVFYEIVKSKMADHLDTLPNGLDPAGMYRDAQKIANTIAKKLGLEFRSTSRRPNQPVTPRQTLVPRRQFNTSGQPYAPPVTSAGDPLDNPNLSPKQLADLARGQARAITDAIIKQSRRGALA